MTEKWDFCKRSVDLSDKKKLIVVDFDHTLFRSPGPNPAYWVPSAIVYLREDEFFPQGAWYKNPRTLEDIGRGIDVEEESAWEGFWNEELVETSKEAIADPTTLAILLTGRTEDVGHIILRMLRSKGLEFDLFICKSKSIACWTLEFKMIVLDSLLPPFTHIDEVVIYEDRPKHVDTFREFLAKRVHPSKPEVSNTDGYSLQVTDKDKKLSKGEVVFVEMERYYLEPRIEDELVLDMMRQRPLRENKLTQEDICEARVLDETNETVYSAENVPPTAG